MVVDLPVAGAREAVPAAGKALRVAFIEGETHVGPINIGVVLGEPWNTEDNRVFVCEVGDKEGEEIVMSSDPH